MPRNLHRSSRGWRNSTLPHCYANCHWHHFQGTSWQTFSVRLIKFSYVSGFYALISRSITLSQWLPRSSKTWSSLLTTWKNSNSPWYCRWISRMQSISMLLWSGRVWSLILNNGQHILWQKVILISLVDHVPHLLHLIVAMAYSQTKKWRNTLRRSMVFWM